VNIVQSQFYYFNAPEAFCLFLDCLEVLTGCYGTQRPEIYRLLA